jgi:hypothetical protein
MARFLDFIELKIREIIKKNKNIAKKLNFE